MPVRPWLVIFAWAGCVVSVGGDPVGDGGSEDGGASEDGGGDAEIPCPDEVPEDYRLRWDCQANACDDDQRMVYHEATGASTAGGELAAEEHWFMFWNGGDEWCKDTMSFTGGPTEFDPEEYGCATCEEIFEVSIAVEDTSCGVSWASVFNNEDEPRGPYDGFLMFDTHTSFGDRNPDDAMLVNLASVDWDEETTLSDPNYGRGKALPSAQADGPPEDYTWTSNGRCYTVQ